MIGGIGAALAALWISMRRKLQPQSAEGGPTTEDIPGSPDVPEPKPDPGAPSGNGKPPKPLAVGVPGKDPEIDALLAEMDAFFEANGVDTNFMSAYEVTLMRKTPSKSVAIPPRKYWPRMARTGREIVMPMRRQANFAFRYGGYRPPDYNAAVGGAEGSRHMWFEGVDIRPEPYTDENRRALAIAGAQQFIKQPKSLKVGLGVYGKKTPSNIHVDTGYKRRTWRDAASWVAKAKATS